MLEVKKITLYIIASELFSSSRCSSTGGLYAEGGKCCYYTRAGEKEIGQEIEQVRFFATRHTECSLIEYSLTPLPTLLSLPLLLAVIASRLMFAVRCSNRLPATRHPRLITVRSPLPTSVHTPTTADRTLRPHSTSEMILHARTLIRRLLIGLTAYAAHKMPASHLHTHAPTNDCANHQAARASSRNLGHTV